MACERANHREQMLFVRDRRHSDVAQTDTRLIRACDYRTSVVFSLFAVESPTADDESFDVVVFALFSYSVADCVCPAADDRCARGPAC